MPFTETNVMEQRVKFVIRASSGRGSLTEVCREFGISRQTGYRWLKRYAEAGSVFLIEEHSRRPHRSPMRTAKKLEEKVISARNRYGWGGKKLRALLLKDGIDLPAITIDRIIKRHGLISEEATPSKALKRFEREHPNELWQMDFKGEFRTPHGTCYPLTILDDHSRYSLAIHALERTTAEVVQKHVFSTFCEYGVPDAMLMDHGSPWWATVGEAGLTSFSVALMKQDIKLIYSGVGHPQTQGKIERFHRTLKHAVKHRRTEPTTTSGWKKLFDEIRTEYNDIRPHEGIAMLVPSNRYKPSNKEFMSVPRPWVYPEGALLQKVNAAGNINFKGHQFFISKALSDDYVRLQEFDETLLVSYRNMYVRELDPVLRTSTPAVLPMENI